MCGFISFPKGIFQHRGHQQVPRVQPGPIRRDGPLPPEPPEHDPGVPAHAARR